MANAARINEATVIEHDVMCHGCGYNLRGLSSHGRCPECNAPIMASTSGDELCFADPGWLETVIRGAKCIVGGLVAAWLLLIVSLAISFQIDNFSFVQVVVGLAGVELFPACILLRGVWMFAAPEPGRSFDTLRPQAWVRIGVVSSIVTGLLAIFAWPFGSTVVVLLAALGSPMGVVGFPSILKFTLHVEYMAVRSGDVVSQQWAGKMGAFYLVTWGSIAVVALLALLTGGLGGFSALVASAAPLFAIFGSMVLLLPYRILTPLRQAQERAQDRWEASTSKQGTPKYGPGE